MIKFNLSPVNDDDKTIHKTENNQRIIKGNLLFPINNKSFGKLFLKRYLYTNKIQTSNQKFQNKLNRNFCNKIN